MKKGQYKLTSELADLEKLGLGITNGKVDPQDVENFRRRVVTKVLRKKLPLSKNQIESEVNSLISNIVNRPSEIHENLTILERWGATPLDSKVTVSIATTPWATEWAIAKMIFEFSHTLWPNEYRLYCRPVLDELRDFITRQDADVQSGEGAGLFHYQQAARAPILGHEIIGEFSATRVDWKVVLFGTAEWRHTRNLRPIRAPRFAKRLVVVNPWSGKPKIAWEQLNV